LTSTVTGPKGNSFYSRQRHRARALREEPEKFSTKFTVDIARQAQGTSGLVMVSSGSSRHSEMGRGAEAEGRGQRGAKENRLVRSLPGSLDRV
jgi:hypothetical protein